MKRKHTRFWKKRYNRKNGITVYKCTKHGFETHDSLKVEEHEKAHHPINETNTYFRLNGGQP